MPREVVAAHCRHRRGSRPSGNLDRGRAPLWMLWPRRPRIQWAASGILREFRTAAGSLALVGPGRREDPLLGDLLHLPVQRGESRGSRPCPPPGSRRGCPGRGCAPSSSRTCQTKCGAFQLADACWRSSTGSSLAASYSAAVCASPLSGGWRVFHQLEDIVAPLHDGSLSGGTMSMNLAHSTSSGSPRGSRSRIPDQVKAGGGLGDGGEDGRLGQGQLIEGLDQSSSWPPP